MKSLIELIREGHGSEATSLVEQSLKSKVRSRLAEENKRVAANIFPESEQLEERIGLPKLQYVKGKPVPTPEVAYFDHFRGKIGASEARSRIASIERNSEGGDKLTQLASRNEIAALRQIILLSSRKKKHTNNLLPAQVKKRVE